MEFKEGLLPTGLTAMIKKMVKSPIKAGITIFLIWQVLKPFMKKKENYSERLEDMQASLDNWTTTKMPKWKVDKTFSPQAGKSQMRYVNGKDYAIHDLSKDKLYINGKNGLSLNKRTPITILNKR